jgi:hypothetical protein
MGQRGALVTSWGAGRPGVSTAKGMEVFAEALGWYDELAKTGRISGYRVFGSINTDRGMLIAEGDAAELAKLTTEPESIKHLALAAAVVDDVESSVYIGGSVDDIMGYYTTATEAVNAAGLGL